MKPATIQGVILPTATSIRALLAEHGAAPSRALGQHFLADPNTARRIVRLADLEPGARVLEIGPGVGSLTAALLEADARITALELDRHVLPLLNAVLESTGMADRVNVVHGDAMTADLAAISGESPVTCVSNLPYNVATPIVMRLLNEAPNVTRLLVMVQREVGERMAAKVGGREYGAVTVKIAFHGVARMVGTVAPSVFLPPPKVDSALVRIDRHPQSVVDVSSRELLFGIIQTGFAQRRKMLRRALVPLFGDRTLQLLEAAGIDPAARAETIELQAWAALARASEA
ncbi:MAG: 16S rRNA (adenine(1518)-N(6)/adenine(1519)-N(6))-dimethyltransferase RsmA [Actinobacteria bacterium]|nr:16S rRNA (adenine(1518)-N(6)/adenine(1519)-N(6))-dimethyltransferase RsmA [Actinomycetota bacterium]